MDERTAAMFRRFTSEPLFVIIIVVTVLAGLLMWWGSRTSNKK